MKKIQKENPGKVVIIPQPPQNPEKKSETAAPEEVKPVSDKKEEAKAEEPEQ